MKELANLEEQERPGWAAEAVRKKTHLGARDQACVSDPQSVGKLLAWPTPRAQRTTLVDMLEQEGRVYKRHLELDSP